MKNIILTIVVILLIVLTGGLIYFANIKEEKIIEKVDEKEVVKKKTTLDIIDLNSKSRPYAVMIDNVTAALPQYGLQNAFIVYEITVEGGLTRLLAVFKTEEDFVIGPIRSGRHYFLDYAMENDAIFVHHGYSPQAIRDMNIYKIQHLDGGNNGSSVFYRDSKLYAPHNSFTTLAGLKSRSEKLGYDLETEEILLNYSIEEVDLSMYENSVNAENIEVYYSTYSKTRYVYDSEKKVYLRFYSNNMHVDGETNNQYFTKNIIIIKVANMIDPYNSLKGRQTLKNVGNGEGYYITNGFSIPITWEKESRETKTIYKDLDGNEIKINDGNTFIQIQPINQKTVIESIEVIPETEETIIE